MDIKIDKRTKMVTENGTLLSVGTLLMSMGVASVGSNLWIGLAQIVVGAGILFGREYLKIRGRK